MLTEILTIGDELCRGEIVDTNSAWIGEKLWDLDITVSWMTSCRDLREDIEEALRSAVGRAELVGVSGGLGPTEDDITVDVVAELAGTTATIDEVARQRMEARFAQAKFKLTANNLRQVRVPERSRVFANPVGLAPGFEVEIGAVPVLCLPGVPRELHAICTDSAFDRVVEIRESKGEAERIARRIYRVFGKGESHIGAALSGLTHGVDGASLHFQTKFPETLVKLVVRDRDLSAAQSRLADLEVRMRDELAPALYGVDDDTLAGVLGRALTDAGATLATAESCTGGMIGSLITDVAGSSAYFVGGAVTYTDAEKVRQLGIRAALIDSHGAVSKECVEAMAQGCRERFACDYAVAVSGIAGPGGGSADKPVGTVWLAVASRGGKLKSRRFVWPGARDQVRTLAAYWALAMVLKILRDDGDA